MRVGINARLLASPDRRGFNRYTAELARAIAAERLAEVVLFSDAPVHPSHGLTHLPCVAAPVRPQWHWQHGWLPRALATEGIDVFHAPAHWGVPWRSSCPVVATIHDLADRELRGRTPTGPLPAFVRHRLEERLVVLRARRIITVSEWSARSIVRHLGVPRERVVVTVEGASGALAQVPPADVVAGTLRRLGLTPPHFLYVGGFEARKNLGVIVRALAALAPEQRVVVAFAGGEAADRAELERAAAAAGVGPWVCLLGNPDDRTLAAIYAAAVAVIVPSWLEGFGLPVVEAMHVGTPAIVSSAGALPETAGDAAVVFPPESHEALAAAMLQLATDVERRRELVARAHSRAARYTWTAAAAQTVAAYEAALTGA